MMVLKKTIRVPKVSSDVITRRRKVYEDAMKQDFAEHLEGLHEGYAAAVEWFSDDDEIDEDVLLGISDLAASFEESSPPCFHQFVATVFPCCDEEYCYRFWQDKCGGFCLNGSFYEGFLKGTLDAFHEMMGSEKRSFAVPE